jgi:hypothetical protein
MLCVRSSLNLIFAILLKTVVLANIYLAILHYYISKLFHLYKAGGNKCINIQYLLTVTICV